METEHPNSATMNGLQNSNSESESKMIYKYQRVAHKQYLRANYSLPDTELLKQELNVAISTGNYSDFYWKWKALAFGKKDKYPYYKILIFIFEQLFANPDNDDYQSLAQHHFHLTRIILDCIKKGLQPKPFDDKLHNEFILNLNTDIIVPCFLLICKINDKDESIQLKNVVNILSDGDKIDDFPIALAKNNARKVLTFWRIILRVTVKFLLSSRMRFATKPIANWHMQFIKSLAKMVSRICEKKKQDQTVEDLFVITEIAKMIHLFYRKGIEPADLNMLTEEVVNFIVKYPTLACSYFSCADDLVDIYISYMSRIQYDLEKEPSGQQKLYQHRWALSQILTAINFENEAYEDFSLLTKLTQIEFQKKLERLLALLVDLGCKSLLENYLTKDNFKHFLLSVDIFSQFPNKGIRNLPTDKDALEIQKYFSESFQNGLDLKNFEVVLIHTQKATLHRDLIFSFLNKSRINFQTADEINQDIIKRILQNYENLLTSQPDPDYSLCVLRLILRCHGTSLPKDYPILQLLSKIMKSLSLKWDSLKGFVEFFMGNFAHYVQKKGSMQKFEQAKVMYESLVQIVEEHCDQFKKIEQILSNCLQESEESYLNQLSSFLELHYLIAALFSYVNNSNTIGAGLPIITDKTRLFVPKIFCESCKTRKISVPRCITFLTFNQFECCDFCGKLMRPYTLDVFSSGQEGRNITVFLQEIKNLHKKLTTKIKNLRNAKRNKLKENYGSDISNVWNLFFNKEFQFYDLCAELNAFYDVDQGPLE